MDFNLRARLYEFEELGFGCEHMTGPLVVGTKRLALLKGDPEAVRAEFARTDPIVRFYYLVACQRACFRMQASLDTLGVTLHANGNAEAASALASLIETLWTWLEKQFDLEFPQYRERHEQVHDEEHPERAAWDYGEAPAERPPVPTAPALTDEDDSLVAGLLMGLDFPGEDPDNAR